MLHWKNEDTANRGVGLMVKHELVKSVLDGRTVSPSILTVDLVLCGKVVNIISVHGPQSGG